MITLMHAHCDVPYSGAMPRPSWGRIVQYRAQLPLHQCLWYTETTLLDAALIALKREPEICGSPLSAKKSLDRMCTHVYACARVCTCAHASCTRPKMPWQILKLAGSQMLRNSSFEMSIRWVFVVTFRVVHKRVYVSVLRMWSQHTEERQLLSCTSSLSFVCMQYNVCNSVLHGHP